ncbi:unnamed protein product [Arctia plantaginis]|uniref:Uncharacterized protein n=1 Tax=Arctia plantaginis TaxID=874455 RepID=A0A8S0ZJH9_ARCPL|nr:unnamed protein product [Arctia plantaginis]
MRMQVSSRKTFITRRIIKGKEECNRWLDDYSRSFYSYIKHVERGKLDRRAIASGSIVIRLQLKIIEEFHLYMAKSLPGSTISIGGEEKKKIMNELQMSSLKEGFRTSYSLQGTEDASKWNECMNPLMFAIVHQCWINDEISLKKWFETCDSGR